MGEILRHLGDHAHLAVSQRGDAVEITAAAPGEVRFGLVSDRLRIIGSRHGGRQDGHGGQFTGAEDVGMRSEDLLHQRGA